MKYIPRAEISTIKDVLYPLRKKKDTTWDKKNLQDLKELKQKLIRLKEEKQKEEENKPEPFKLRQFKNIPSKFMDTEDWVNKKQKRYYENKENNEIYIRNSSGSGKRYHNKIMSKNLNKSASIKKLPKIIENKNKKILFNNKSNNNISNISHLINESKSYSSINELINNNNINTNSYTSNNNNNNNIDFNLEKELEKIPINNNDGQSLFDRPMSNSEEIEKLIKEYKEKYGDTAILESLLKEYEEVKQKRKANIEKEEIIKNDNQKLIEENKNNIIDINIKDNLNDNLINYEPYDDNSNKKPPIPSIDDAPLILPKINKNYVKENIQLIVENKIPQKKYNNNNNNDIIENKHKNFGKVPEYIKRFEMERELERQEKIRKKEELKYPKGTKLLSEDERVKTLNSLIKSQQELNLLLLKMPITNRSVNIQKRKEELIKKLDEIKKAIEMFSKKRVFVKK